MGLKVWIGSHWKVETGVCGEISSVWFYIRGGMSAALGVGPPERSALTLLLSPSCAAAVAFTITLNMQVKQKHNVFVFVSEPKKNIPSFLPSAGQKVTVRTLRKRSQPDWEIQFCSWYISIICICLTCIFSMQGCLFTHRWIRTFQSH